MQHSVAAKPIERDRVVPALADKVALLRRADS